MHDGASPDATADADPDPSAAGDDPDASAGVAITNPVTGVSIRPDGDDALVELAPGAQGPPEHVHPRVEERFVVREGEVTFRIDGRERALGPGTEIRASPGTPHTFANRTDAAATLVARTVPESERLGEVVATLFGLAHDGRTDDRGRPGFLQGAAMAEATLGETYLTDAPYALQRAYGRLVGPLARALGYRATYEEYLEEEFWRDRAGE